MGVLRGIAEAVSQAVHAATPVPYAPSRATFQTPAARNDSAAQLATMGSVGTVFAIVNKTSTGTAEPNWSLCREATRPDPEPEPVTRHAALDLLNHPNDFMSRYDLFEIGQQHIDLVGETYLVVARSPLATLPLELWPVRPDRMAPVPHPKEFLAGWVYTSPDGEQVPLDVDDIIHIKMPNPLDPYRGLGPIQAILTDIDASRFTAAWNRNFFINSAMPGGIIEVPERWNDDEFKEFQTRWREQHQGVAQAHRVGVIEGGAKWVESKFSMRDMQFAELRRVSREIIREAFGFPKSMLGDSDDVNRAVAEAQEYVFGRWLIQPRLGRWKGALNHRLLPMFGKTAAGLCFEHADVTPANEEAENAARDSKVAAVAALVGVGFDPSETLKAFGLPDIPMSAAEGPDLKAALAAAAQAALTGDSPAEPAAASSIGNGHHPA